LENWTTKEPLPDVLWHRFVTLGQPARLFNGRDENQLSGLFIEQAGVQEHRASITSGFAGQKSQ
jgi:hypothetical protein